MVIEQRKQTCPSDCFSQHTHTLVTAHALLSSAHRGRQRDGNNPPDYCTSNLKSVRREQIQLSHEPETNLAPVPYAFEKP